MCRLPLILLLLSLDLLVSAESPTPPRPSGIWARLNAKVESLGFPGLPVPLEIRKDEIPVLSKDGKAEIPDVQLVYAEDVRAPVPPDIAVDLKSEEAADVAATLGWREFRAAAGAAYRLEATGLSALKLVDLQFVRPLGGDTDAIREWRVALTVLRAADLALREVRDGQVTPPVVQAAAWVLGGQYRPMQVKAKKRTIRLESNDEKKRMEWVGMKPKDANSRRAAIGLLPPESGDEPTLLMVTAGRRQARFGIVPSDPAYVPKPKQPPEDWTFLGHNETRVSEIILPSQFDGQEALGVFVRILAHEKEPFHPRTRRATLEVVLVSVRLEE
jgi:hypothetical protein